MNLKVSLIVTTYNCIDNFRRTMRSIAMQDYDNIEVVIKDGMSTDGTLQAISEYAAEYRYPIVWKSERDMGIYDAINKAYQMSTGDVIGICNDLFTRTDALTLMINEMQGSDADGVHADLIYATDTNVKRYWHMGQGDINEGWMPGHPTLYLKRWVYETYGLYDTSYICSADYEFMVRILKDRKVKLAYVPQVLVRMFYGGTSTGSAGSYWISVKEGHRALRQNNIHFAWLLIFRRTLIVLKQFKDATRRPEINQYIQNCP